MRIRQPRLRLDKRGRPFHLHRRVDPPKTQGEGRRDGEGERGSRNLCSGRLVSMWRLLRLQHDSITTSLTTRNSQKHRENNLKRLLARYLTHRFFGGGDFFDLTRWLRSVVQGHFQYYAVPRNQRKLDAFKYQVYCLWFQSLRRRSQRHRITGDRMNRLAAKWLPPVRTLHPYPEQRLRVTT